MHKFKTRNEFKRFYPHGESFHLFSKNASEKQPEILDEFSKYSSHEVWNTDSFGLFYKLSLAPTIDPGRLPEEKVEGHLTSSACANGDETGKLSLIVSRKFKNPKIRDRSIGKNMGLIIIQTEKAGRMQGYALNGSFDLIFY